MLLHYKKWNYWQIPHVQKDMRVSIFCFIYRHAVEACVQEYETTHFITITILDIIHWPNFYLNHDVSGTGFCLCVQIKPSQLGPIPVRRQSLALSTGSKWVGSTWRRKQNPVSETSYFKKWIMSRIEIIIYHRHKPIDSINLLGSKRRRVSCEIRANL
jgi:hypothetical protein